MTPPRYHLRTALSSSVARLPPAAFALVMATGIVAIATHRFGMHELSGALAIVNLVAFPTLWAVLLLRIVMFPARVLADWSDHARAPGYFTLVAATAVVGSQFVVVHGAPGPARVLWWFCVVLWAVCTYGIFATLTLRREKPPLAQGINGGWLIAVVATQSVCVLGCALDGAVFDDRDATLFLLMSFWLGGGMLYIWIIGLIFYRTLFFPFSPKEMMPPYWINMGAVAISTLAGAWLAGAVESSTMLSPLRPFILGFTALFWATATWWIPMLIILGVWRHHVARVPISYDPMYWGLVFPLGMYSVCTARLAGALDAPFLLWIARVFVVVAAAVWLLVFLGLCRRLLTLILIAARDYRDRHRHQPPVGGQIQQGGNVP